jgi:hypothetical protein
MRDARSNLAIGGTAAGAALATAMGMSNRTVHCHDVVNQPYDRVRDTVLANPHYVFRHATAAGATRAAALHVSIGALDVGADVMIQISDTASDTNASRPMTKLVLEWTAVKNPVLFPRMVATLAIFPLTASETEVELDGRYAPALGKLGEVFDIAVGHRLAEESATRFIQDVAGWLREELATSGDARPVGS